MPEQGKCRSCGKTIWWLTTTAGNTMPVDPEEVPDGNIVLVDGKAHTLRGDLFEEKHEGPRYKSHFATCPQAAQHRRKGKAK